MMEAYVAWLRVVRAAAEPCTMARRHAAAAVMLGIHALHHPLLVDFMQRRPSAAGVVGDIDRWDHDIVL
jgi:hypothetical protein